MKEKDGKNNAKSDLIWSIFLVFAAQIYAFVWADSHQYHTLAFFMMITIFGTFGFIIKMVFYFIFASVFIKQIEKDK